MPIRIGVLTCLLAFVVVSAGCGTGGPAVYVAAGRPAQVVLPDTVKVIAVVPFVAKDRQSEPYAAMASGKLASKLNETLGGLAQSGGGGEDTTGARPIQPRKIVAVSDIKDILKIQDLGVSGITDPATAAKAGKILNADTAIFGDIQVQTNEEHGTKTEPTVDIGSMRPTTKTVSTIRRTATVSMAFKMVNVETGELIASKSSARSYDSGQQSTHAGLTGGGGGAGAFDQVVPALAVQCVNDFYALIAPHVEVFEVVLAGGKGDLAKSGVQLAQAGDYAAAARQFEQAVQADPADHGSIFNLAIMRLLAGDVAAARAGIVKASGMKADPKYSQALSDINRAVADNAAVKVRPATEAEKAEFLQTVKVTKAKTKRFGMF